MSSILRLPLQMNYIGEIAALGVAISWTGSALFFEKAGNAIGSLTLNLLRIGLAIILLGAIRVATGEGFFPGGASFEQWLWLSLSGFVGFFLGDLCLFKSYTLVGARMAQLIMTLAPVITAMVAFVFLDEILLWYKIVGILLVVGGIVMAMLGKAAGDKLRFNVSLKGFLFALGGAIGQALGLILSKKGIGDYNAMAATQIRAITGFISFIILLTLIKHWPKVQIAVQNKASMKAIFWGTLFGPVIGVSLSLFAVQHTSTGVAATLIGLVPIFIIVPSVVFLKQKVTLLQVFGALVSVGGSLLFFV